MELTEQNVLEFRCELEELITERVAMIAENEWRVSVGKGISYGEDNFLVIQQKMKTLRERLIHISEAPEPEPYGVRPVL